MAALSQKKETESKARNEKLPQTKKLSIIKSIDWVIVVR